MELEVKKKMFRNIEMDYLFWKRRAYYSLNVYYQLRWLSQNNQVFAFGTILLLLVINLDLLVVKPILDIVKILSYQEKNYYTDVFWSVFQMWDSDMP